MDEYRINPVDNIILHAAENADPKTAKDDPDGEENLTCWHQFTRLVCYPVTITFIFIKIFYFAFLAGLGSILPYLSLYYKQMGLSPQQIGVISGLRPIVGFLSGPVWGALGDRFNIRKVLLLISIVSWMAIFVGIAFIPPPDFTGTCPEKFIPYRKVGSLESNGGTPKVLTTANNGTQVVSEGEYNILKESIGWIYDSDGLHQVFITILLLIVLGEFFQSPTTALSDAGTIQTLGRDNLDYYGSQRAWGPIGFAVGSMAVGAVVASTRHKETFCGVTLFFTDYESFVYVFIGFMVLAFICATRFKFEDHRDKNPEKVELTQPEKNTKPPTPVKTEPAEQQSDYSAVAVLKVFTNVHYGSWLATAFYVGVCNGVIWGFLYWHLENLGADQMLIGVVSGAQCLSEFIMFFFVHYVIRLIGHMGVMYLGLAFYAIRFAIYAAIQNPWWVLPAELVQGITFSCVWVSLTAYSTLSVPRVSLATVQGLMHGIYFGLGNGTGHLVGGILIDVLGASITFVIMAVTTVIVLGMFIVAQKCSTKPLSGYEEFDDSKVDETSISGEDKPSVDTADDESKH